MRKPELAHFLVDLLLVPILQHPISVRLGRIIIHCPFGEPELHEMER
jgi:hypothetical protein